MGSHADKSIFSNSALRYRTVVFDSDLRFDNLCGSHLQSQRVTLTLKMSKRPSTAIDVLSYRNNTEEIIHGSPRK